MPNEIRQLYPGAQEQLALEGLYLGHNLRRLAQEKGKPYVYANFVTSLDGRIAVPHATRPGLTVPKATANERDWRLFQELAAQADLIISSGRYLRDWVDGRAQEILEVDDPQYADLRKWREEQGLAPQPDIAIVSHSLNFPVPDALTEGRGVVVFTTDMHDPARVPIIEAAAGKVYIASKDGEVSVDGALMLQQIEALGYQTVYSAAGPRILHLLLAGGALDRLYLTYASRLLGGKTYATILEGDPFDPPPGLALKALYHDPVALEGLGQLFAVYDVE
ncbi:MAG: RibD family protein [Chloroflexota bacterium]